MAITGFPASQAFKVLELSEEDCGLVKAGEDMELAHIRLWIYIHGTYGGSETLKINLYSQNDVLLHQSDASTLSEISNIGANWLGWLRFDFNRENVKSGTEFKIKVASTNYARNGDTYYIGIGFDWSDPALTNVANSGINYGIYAPMYGYKRLQDEF